MRTNLYDDLFLLEKYHWWHKAKRKLMSKLLEKYCVTKNNQIVDIGCGTGGNLQPLEKYGKVTGLDKSKHALAYCKKRGFHLLTQRSSENTGIKKDSIDIITMLDILEHVDEDKTLKEIYRILRKSGVVLITVPAYQFLWSKWDEALHHKRRYTKESLQTILSKYKFTVLHISYVYSFLLVPVILIRTIKNIYSKNTYPSDFSLNNRLINSLLFSLSQIEQFFILRTTLPFGTSIVCVAKK